MGDYLRQTHFNLEDMTKSYEQPTRIHRDQLVTLGDLEHFKSTLLNDIERMLHQNKISPKKEWLRSTEVRKVLGISAGTLQHFRVNGTLKFSKVGGIVFYKYEDIIAVLEKSSE